MGTSSLSEIILFLSDSGQLDTMGFSLREQSHQSILVVRAINKRVGIGQMGAKQCLLWVLAFENSLLVQAPSCSLSLSTAVVTGLILLLPRYLPVSHPSFSMPRVLFPHYRSSHSTFQLYEFCPLHQDKVLHPYPKHMRLFPIGTVPTAGFTRTLPGAIP